MNTTERFNALSKKVVNIQDIDVLKFKNRENLETWSSVCNGAYGVSETVVDDALSFEGELFFLLRCKMNYLREPSTSWREGVIANTNIMIISNDIDRAISIMERFLSTHPQYFVTYTDENGYNYGKEEG